LSGFWEEFDAAYEAGGFFMLIAHPFLTGRLARWKKVEEWLEQTLKDKNVWFASLEDIADHLDHITTSGGYIPREEHLPYFDSPVLNKP
jgi:hypothetical protein